MCHGQWITYNPLTCWDYPPPQPYWTYTTLYDCDDCNAGSYSDATNSHSCKGCPAGTWSGSGFTSCPKCLPGTFSTAGASFCAQCPPGTYAGGDGTANACTPCQEGWAAPDSGSTKCTICPEGTFANSQGPGATACEPCIPGTYQNQAGAYKIIPQSGTGCDQAPAGQYVPGYKATGFLPCPVGTASNALGAPSCPSCELGVSFAAVTGQTACKTCTGHCVDPLCHACKLDGSCPIIGGYCYLANALGVTTCVAQGTYEGGQDIDNQCKECVPSYMTSIWEGISGKVCDDQNICTYNDGA